MEAKKSVIAGVGYFDVVKLYRGERIIQTVHELRSTLRNETSLRGGGNKNISILRPEIATDLFYLLNLPIPILEDLRPDESGYDDEYLERYDVISQIMRHPKLHYIRSYTIADSLVSTIAAASILERLISMLSEKESKSGHQTRGLEGGDSKQDDSSADSGSREGKPDISDKIHSVLDKVLEQTKKDVETAKRVKIELLSQLAGTGSVLSYENVAEEILKLARLTDISRILEKIEGLEIPGGKGKRIRCKRGWIEGLEVGSDLERIHYSQLALPKVYFMVAFAESKLLLYSRYEELSKGPIYVLLDKSGSMVGEKIDWARAVAVALLKKAVSETRTFYARYFDATTYDLIRVSRNPKASEVVNALLNIARVMAGGGTDIMRAILTACNDITRNEVVKGVSDIVLISDGEDRVNVNTVRNALAKAKARLHTVMIHGNNQDLREVSYRYMTAQKLEGSEIIKVVDFH